MRLRRIPWAAFALLWIPVAGVHGDEHPSRVELFWSRCLPKLDPPPAEGAYRVRSFGRRAETADRLLRLIRDGEKTATFTSPWIYRGDRNATPVVGGFTVVTDFAGVPALLLRTTSVETKRFDEITEADSQHEGPGARPLEAWRRIHWDFFTEVLKPSGRAPAEDMPVTVERFAVACVAEEWP